MEYNCVLANAPVPEVSHWKFVLANAPAPEVLHWKGKIEPTVDSAKHVNGGCRSLASDGKEWECYIGQTAVRLRIIGEGLLGEYAPTPGVG